MNNKFNVNGFLVQDLNKINTLFNILNQKTRNTIFNKYELNYIMGYETWPLWGDKKYKRINDLLDSVWQVSVEPPYEMELIDNMEVLDEYIRCCVKEKKHIRVLLVCSDREKPSIKATRLENIKLKFLGYDYIESSVRDSYTLGNLYGGDFINKDIHLSNINKYGLFNNMETLQEYVDDLNKIYNTEKFLEMFDMCYAKLYQLI